MQFEIGNQTPLLCAQPPPPVDIHTEVEINRLVRFYVTVELHYFRERPTAGRTDGHTNKQTDGQTDGRTDDNRYLFKGKNKYTEGPC